MDNEKEDLVISNDKSFLHLDTVFEFLSRSYWANKRSKERIRISIENSICYGVYINNRQVGFARVVTDGATMYYLCDVFIDEAYRGQSIGKKLIESIIKSEELKDLTGILGTKDAHGLYKQYDFELDQEKMMRRTPDFIRNMNRLG
ncbi:GNAT family N-acetyltransferase [Paenibacillus radicis (ex Xue et al. 2023)]|uniref:GNAT family N-acetyltransferase n=1 Tax=Paenibacillus radicis (ex Xue et al. 2023) TaxID=2972489 RepID=A0ABT1YBQ2_9BACL|nr:GNAT family N-acetyltransferase [Paenibacillus radicis (ex Xue et al. 2023)]MCR8630624.1 GNAT family N-acetyltransferase [Paenibacillus radicis (ex Xue et al. 2023)]